MKRDIYTAFISMKFYYKYRTKKTEAHKISSNEFFIISILTSHDMSFYLFVCVYDIKTQNSLVFTLLLASFYSYLLKHIFFSLSLTLYIFQ
jgi:hypothetical protein